MKRSVLLVYWFTFLFCYIFVFCCYCVKVVQKLKQNSVVKIVLLKMPNQVELPVLELHSAALVIAF